MKNLYKIEFRYTYIDQPEGNYKDFIFTNIMPSGRKEASELVLKYIDKIDSSMLLKSIVDITTYREMYLEQ
jgi:hypothetical protein